LSGYSMEKASGSIRLMWIMYSSEASVGEETVGFLTVSLSAELFSSVAFRSKYTTGHHSKFINRIQYGVRAFQFSPRCHVL
jgi:hypothetical protein